jgi:hypothetical protein
MRKNLRIVGGGGACHCKCSRCRAASDLIPLAQTALLHWLEVKDKAEDVLRSAKATAAEIELARFLTTGTTRVAERPSHRFGQDYASDPPYDPHDSYDFVIRNLARKALDRAKVKRPSMVELVLEIIASERGCDEDGPVGPDDDNWFRQVWIMARRAAGLPVPRSACTSARRLRVVARRSSTA